MTAVSVTNNSVRLDAMNDTTNVSSIGGGAGAGAEPDFYLQGGASVSRKVGTTEAGFQVDTPTSVNMNTLSRAMWMAKLNVANKDALRALARHSMQARIGSDSSNYFDMPIHGAETYPLKGGWVIVPIAIGIADFQTEPTGTPVITAIDYFGITAWLLATSKGENVMMDAIDVGIGLCLVGGTSTDPDGTFLDFLADDQGDPTNGRFGFFSEENGTLSVFGLHYIGQNASGTASQTVFTSNNESLVFPRGMYSATMCGLHYDLSVSGTVITINNGSFVGRGNFGEVLFNTETDIDSANNEITNQDVIDKFEPGDAVTFNSYGGAETPGLTPSTTTYYVGKYTGGSVSGLTLHSTRRNAMGESGTPSFDILTANLTASTAGNGEVWGIQHKVVGVPSIFITGSSGSAVHNACSFVNMFGWSVANLNNVVEFNNCIFRGCAYTGGQNPVLDGCTVTDQQTTNGVATCRTNNPANITNNIFDGAGTRGHALRVDSTGTYDLDGNQFLNYGPDGQSFDTELNVSSVNDTITITGHALDDGHPVYYEDAIGGTETIGLTTGTLYHAHVIDANTISLHLNKGDALNDNARVNLTASGAGNGETHVLYSADAAIHNNTGGTVTLNIIGGGNLPTVRNSGNAVTVVNLTYVLTIIIRDNLGNLLSGIEVTVVKTSDTSELYHLENTTGTGEAVYSYASSLAGTDVDILFMSTGYKPDISDIKNLLLPGQSQTINVTMFPDENYSNP